MNSYQFEGAPVSDRIVRQIKSMTKSNGSLYSLTPREIEVLYCIAWGMSNAEVARALAISPRTAETHRRSLISKLGAKNSCDAVRLAISYGLDPDLDL